MQKLPQDFAFPLGLGSKKHNNNAILSNDNKSKSQINNNTNSTLPGSSNSDDLSPRAPYQDLDTINL